MDDYLINYQNVTLIVLNYDTDKKYQETLFLVQCDSQLVSPCILPLFIDKEKW